MTHRRELITVISAGVASALIGQRQAAGQTVSVPSTITIPRVLDVQGLNSALENVPAESRMKLKDLIQSQAAVKESNCGCNAVCRCNDDVKSCCEQKCPCNAKSGDKIQMESLYPRPDYRDVEKLLKPDEASTLKELGATLLELPAFGGKGFTGISDKATGLKSGNFTPNDLEKFFSIRDLNGNRVENKFFGNQISPATR